MVKGCAKDPPTGLGCTYIRDVSSVACISQGDFSNGYMRPPDLPPPENLCYQCSNFKVREL